jgi:CRISPR-associated protein Cas2
MLVVVTYDVSTVDAKPGARRLRRVAKVCESYGVRVQKSVFECQVGATEWVQLRAKLLREIKLDEDSLRFYFIDQADRVRIEHHGVDKPPDLEADPLIV